MQFTCPFAKSLNSNTERDRSRSQSYSVLVIHREEDMPTKEKIIPPSKEDLKEAGKELRKGSGPAGRVESDASVAKRQGAKRKGAKRK